MAPRGNYTITDDSVENDCEEPMCSVHMKPRPVEETSPSNHQAASPHQQIETVVSTRTQLETESGQLEIETESETATATEIDTTPPPSRSILKKDLQTSMKSRTHRKVQFDSLQIRTYPQILGDHPCCSSGLPLSLGWEYTSQHTSSLQQDDELDSDQVSPVKQPRKHLRLDAYRRWEILKNALVPCWTSTMPMSSCRTESSADTVPVLVPVQVPLRLLEDVDGNDANARIASASLDAMYSEVELKRAERRISRKRGERMRKRKVVQRFFEAPIHAE